MGDFCGDNCTGTPLTTVFTPPASCTDNWTPVGSPYVEGGIQVTLTRNVIDPACVPTQWIPGCDVCYPGLSNISPGLCPEGAQAARTGISTGVTTYYCCPFADATHSGEGSSARCFRTFRASLQTLIYEATRYTSDEYVVTTFTNSATQSLSISVSTTTFVVTTTDTVFITYGTLVAKPFVVRFREADSQSNGTALSPEPSTERTSAAHSESPTIDTNDQALPGLPTGTKAGIGVGAALGALSLVALGFAVFWRRRKKRKSNEAATSTPAWNSGANDTNAPSEMPTKWSTAELNAQPMPQEMYASRYREVNPEDPAEMGGGVLDGR